MENTKHLIDSPIKHIEEVYRKPFMCAGFSRRYAEVLITGEGNDKKDDIYNRASAWDFQYHNRRIWAIEDGLFNPKILKKGMLLGIKLPYSIYNHRKDERGNSVRYTHMAAFKEIKNTRNRMEYIISHNVGGIILCEDIFEFLSRNNAFVVDVFVPKNKASRQHL